MTESLLDRAASVHEKVAAASVLWKYADPDGNEFYLLKKLVPVRSPYSGKSFTVKPERVSLSDVGKELKSDAKAEKAKKASEDFWKVTASVDESAEDSEENEGQPKTAAEAKGKTLPGTLWEYTDEDGNKFYLPKKQTGAIKSPFTGKTFTAKPTKNTLSDVGKDIKEQAKSKKASDEEQGDEQDLDEALVDQQEQTQDKQASVLDTWKVNPAFGVLAQEEKQQDGQQKTACAPGQCKCGGQCGCTNAEGQEQQGKQAKKIASQDPVDLAAELLNKGDKHGALAAIKEQWDDLLEGVKKGKDANDRIKKAGGGDISAPDLVKAHVLPKLEALADTVRIVAKQLEQRIK